MEFGKRHDATDFLRLDVPREELSALDEWCDEWLGTGVINQSMVDDPTALPPGFNLPRHLWANFNHFRTGQGQCAANLARWHKIPDPSCSCGAAKQTMSHNVNDCLYQDFLAVLLLYISLVMRQSSGWACSAMQTIRRRRSGLVTRKAPTCYTPGNWCNGL